ncbi:uroporphyrinogen-III synthase [Niabella drilacis]|uniref:Uroporphyrinogen-III synthase n=1 Tax=Niabella drilacis (strain DSM 25811 / CCM 8410 / CCUG 62505 / LMG 26954 / E90) TaxID=1285928 RepID=A0A1G6YPA7_NIADE|nr:uroporphyrinogen-III synthase [Niabella drilacis]SDD91843.1 uroporphyrinogen-III synthase [Niabella drilacis]
MSNRPLHILSTKLLDDALMHRAGDRVLLDCRSFLQTQPVAPGLVAALLADVSLADQEVIFTSANAVKAVAAAVTGSPQWKVFCIEAATRKKVQELFPQTEIRAAAPNGAQLVNQIIRQAPDQVVFFCGNLRLDTIPDGLKKNAIPCREKVVYETIKTPVPVKPQYDGILFYSPSGVASFFAVNKISPGTKAFSIGPSTTEALKKYTSNIVEAPHPDVEQMIGAIANSSW